jgi:hypothetical protein
MEYLEGAVYDSGCINNREDLLKAAEDTKEKIGQLKKELIGSIFPVSARVSGLSDSILILHPDKEHMCISVEFKEGDEEQRRGTGVYFSMRDRIGEGPGGILVYTVQGVRYIDDLIVIACERMLPCERHYCESDTEFLLVVAYKKDVYIEGEHALNETLRYRSRDPLGDVGSY